MEAQEINMEAFHDFIMDMNSQGIQMEHSGIGANVGPSCVIRFLRYVPTVTSLSRFHDIMIRMDWVLVAASTDTTFHYIKKSWLEG